MQIINYKSILFLVVILCSNSDLFAQNINKKRFAVPIEHFKKKYEPKDSLGFIVYEGDTLIRVTHYKAPKGVAVPYEYKDSTFLNLYKKLVFREIHKDSANSKPMKYWKNKIKIYFSKGISRSIIREIMDFTNRIDKEVDSLKISKVNSIENSNFIIYYDTDYEFKSEIKNKKASDYWITWNDKNQIEKGYIRILKGKMFSEKLATQKIKTLFVGSLGWFNLSDDLSCDNYLSNCYSDNKHLTKIDIEILKYHYSYGICKGTRRNAFEEQHERCKELIKQGKPPGMFIHSE